MIRKKRALALLLVLSVCLTPAPAALASDEPEDTAAHEMPVNADDLVESEAVIMLDGADSYTINGVTVSMTSSSVTNNCYTYAQEIYKKIWGVGFSGDPSSSNNMLRNITSLDGHKLTVENVKKYITAASLGSVIRLTNSSYVNSSSNSVGHSQILVAKDENGFRVLESGVSEGRRDRYMTWAEYVQWWTVNTSNRGYFQYIEWPNAPACSDSGTVTPPTPLEECDCSDVYAGTYICATQSSPLNIRSGHGTNYASIGSIPKGAEVTVTKSDGTWAHVIYNGVSGYASMAYLKQAAENETLGDLSGDGTIGADDAALYLHSGKAYLASQALRTVVKNG